MIIKLKKLSDKAVIPSNANMGDAGYDLYATHNQMLAPMERALFKTNIALEIPSCHYGQICDRSGNAYKKGLHVLAGIIDETYRGDVGVVLINLGQIPVIIKEGDKIAQIIFKRYEKVQFYQGELTDSERGEKGYGSSDVEQALQEINCILKSSSRPGFGPLSPRIP